jgi:peptidoglycan biosynthesis protein MviN/MurJ (putative lipid II flippase)
MGQAGISAAVAGSSAVQMLLLFVLARGKLGGLEIGEIGDSVLRTLVASVIGAVAAYSVARLCGVTSHVIPGLAAIATFGVLFVAVAWAVRSPELEEITSALRRRLGRGKVAA